MHTLYENKNYVHKLFTNIYEKKLQSKNIKHKKSNKKRKEKKNVPKPTLWLPRSPYKVAIFVQQHRLGWMLCFCIHVEKGNGKIKVSIRWASRVHMWRASEADTVGNRAPVCEPTLARPNGIRGRSRPQRRSLTTAPSQTKPSMGNGGPRFFLQPGPLGHASDACYIA